MRLLLALVLLCLLADRLVEASLATAHPVVVLAPATIAAVTACVMCLCYMFSKDA